LTPGPPSINGPPGLSRAQPMTNLKRPVEDVEDAETQPVAKAKQPAFSPIFRAFEVDALYHLGLNSSQPLKDMFGDVQVVTMTGSEDRSTQFAKLLSKEFADGTAPKNLATAGRGNLFKVGKVMSMSHGMGSASCSIFLHEVAKLCYHAGCDFNKLKFVRLGTCGGLGLPGGDVCLTLKGCDAELNFGWEGVSCGVKKRWPSEADRTLNTEIMEACKDAGFKFAIHEGHTIATDDFYEAQGRLDGALSVWYTEEDKLAFLRKADSMGIRNIEMEANLFCAFFKKLGASAAVIGGVLLDRLQGDQHPFTTEQLKEFSARPQHVAVHWMRKRFATQ